MIDDLTIYMLLSQSCFTGAPSQELSKGKSKSKAGNKDKNQTSPDVEVTKGLEEETGTIKRILKNQQNK